MPLDHYYHEMINNFENLLKSKDVKNTSKVATPIFFTIGIHIGPTRLLKVGLPNAEYDLEEKVCEGYTSAD